MKRIASMSNLVPGCIGAYNYNYAAKRNFKNPRTIKVYMYMYIVFKTVIKHETTGIREMTHVIIFLIC